MKCKKYTMIFKQNNLSEKKFKNDLRINFYLKFNF